ncbi:MAG: bifunctional methylenetetrahydrofolate dehydrogenase/methenyltetrahydrofolate cyclohydrolase [Lactococcus cremoris]|jgi:methylenetetrahydrofolate dehydrogenase (NADP+) / methenyltetrahydrofolate cyclohydrolase|uniref:Bifunctional protein FolD n=8 Tax=Lactococcus lactis subsp. cremoris TaxID=1359 RepID=FOLD_LACLM|nr:MULTISPECIES: bifunctional methylenetetrahydrofolate dehydrogenase/methenyltetrahydrofolate cyclohydrolase [Lactococcus]A2RLU5.1 RecName: Full=Bifunctional protein FolD; Includes: RecName: Full=Methylenetetrahydrofolate dehydrogenase; Includes: RecName: Full=Methenyltetrahydrofolate cyclohydrolase [Lactococcus cremoris subsp. cremoris MG1363]Q030A3.2 RecName: Full=Bifunctional protein FolD; Includes: RecName: Full=Methylenetetrahydrofolate dehydrogenase; Includes: RecName: Full=Methenyltetrahy
MNLIDGKALAAKMQAELKVKVDKLKEAGSVPGLAVILVGEDPASQIYVRNKARQATAIGLNSSVVRLPETVSEKELLELIEQYNQSEQWHGILVQLPLPKHISEEKVLLAIDPEKDVDGFHPMNMGRLWAGNPLMIPSTPAGIMEMFREYNVELSGKRAVVIGRSNIVGKPMAQLLMMADATVTIAHSRTKNLRELTKEADILVVAIGRDRMIKADDVKDGAVVIDVGMNRDEDGKLHGDVDFDEVKEVASLITPVPGGVGPMTITMLMEQTVRAATRKMNENSN